MGDIRNSRRQTPQQHAAFDARLPALPVGHLGDETLRHIVLAGLVHYRTGPWKILRADDSRIVRIDDGSEPALFAGVPPAMFTSTSSEATADTPESREPRPARTVVLARPARPRRATRTHGPRTRARR